MLVSIVIPAYNEDDVIGAHLDAVVEYCEPQPWDYEVIVVDDGSTDGTAAAVEEKARQHPGVRLLRQGRNRGKGCAVRSGLQAATGDLRGFTDADASTPITELDRVLPVIGSRAQVVIGSRARRDSETAVVAKWHRKVIGRVFNSVLRVLVNLKDFDGRPLADTQCGFKWFTGEAADAVLAHAAQDGFAFDVELLYLANRLGFGIAELPVNWADHGESSVNLWIDPLVMFYRVATVRWCHRGVRRLAGA